MRGVFLHVLGDALGSVVVIISALFIWLTDFDWRHYVDPAMSLIIVAIITITTIPLCEYYRSTLSISDLGEVNQDSTYRFDKTGHFNVSYFRVADGL